MGVRGTYAYIPIVQAGVSRATWKERHPEAFFEQLDLAEAEVTAAALYKQIEFLFTKPVFFSVKPRSSNNMIACIHEVSFLFLQGIHTGSEKHSLAYEGEVTCHCTCRCPHEAAQTIAVGPGCHRTALHPQTVLQL